MASIVGNHGVVAGNESALTEQELRSEALNGRYYSYEDHKWQSMWWVEQLVRKLFACFLDSTPTACLHRSWQAVEKMPEIPSEIKTRIEGLFLDSLYKTNPRSAYSGVIGRVFCRVYRENASTSLNQIDVQKHPTDRSFGVFYNQELRYLVASSGYGLLDFYDPNYTKVSTNDHDTLWDAAGNRTGGVRLAVDYSRLPSCMELSSGKDLLLATVDENQEKVTLVFREAMTRRLLAVGHLARPGINWRVTVIDQDALDQKQITPMLLAWVVLKYSQHYHFPNPDVVKYVKTLPKMQAFRAWEEILPPAP